MMKTRITSEKDLLKILKVKSFNDIKPEDLDKFMGVFTKLSPELSSEFMKNLPEFTTMMKSLVDNFTKLMDEMIQSERKLNETLLSGWTVVLNALNTRLETEGLTKEEENDIILQMNNVMQEMTKEAERDREFRRELHNTTKNVFGIVLAILGLLIVGLRIFSLFTNDNIDDDYDANDDDEET